MLETALTYLQRGQRGIFAEVYFPRRVAAQGTIFNALQKGHDREEVKYYLRQNVDVLLRELQDYRHLFDLRWYDLPRRRRQSTKRVEALARIEDYASPFFGWSNYVVDGVFFGETGMIEEATQVIRLMFCFESKFEKEAVAAGCQDVLRAIMFWIITKQADISPWHPLELRRFVRDQEPFTASQRKFLKKYFEPVGREIFKWMGDCFLFIFGYLVRHFAERLTELGRPEEEIWVASFSNLTVNVAKKAKQ